jgi:UDP-N-acetylglucosamine--N-acetylmuramyl-(pentapeptide) pyrophosphoryl-undecaprenol N-acetylglucosamine transferase
MSASPLVLIAAGGTGGHLFPAESLAAALRQRDVRVALATDHRVGALAGTFPADEVIEIPSATPSGRNPAMMAKAALVLAAGTLRAMREIRRLRPAAIVGFGGYPTARSCGCRRRSTSRTASWGAPTASSRPGSR